jgi:hypothetical protein
MPTVFQGAHDLDVAYGVAVEEWLEELDEALGTVRYAGAVLGVAVAGVLRDCLARMAVSDPIEVQPDGVIDLLTYGEPPIVRSDRITPRG